MYLIYVTIILSLTVKKSVGTPIGEIGTTEHVELVNKNILLSPSEEIASLKKEITGLKKRLTTLEAAASSTSVSDGITVYENLGQDRHSRNKRALHGRGRFQNPEVAFQATLTKSSATFNMLETITFNNVITNIGHAYNKHTGVFIAPLAGTYTFNTNIVSERGHYVEASIVRNGKVVVSAISDHRIPEDGNYFTTWDQGNAVAILRLQKGDKVSVTLQWPEGSHVIHGIGKSSFSGYLLRSHESVDKRRHYLVF